MRQIPVCPSLDGFCYNYSVCNKKFLGICTSKKLVTEKIEVVFKNKKDAELLFAKDLVLMKRVTP